MVKKWIKKNWIWVVIPICCILGIAITPADSATIVPYVLIIFALLYYGIIKYMENE